MAVNVIGISGKKYHGKDTFFLAASAVLSDEGIYVKRYAFADRLKEIAEMYFGLPRIVWEIPELKEKHRYVLQGIGQMIRDLFSEEYWVEYVMGQIMNDSIEHPNMVAFITDVRHINEVIECENFSPNSTVVRVYNPNVKSSDNHESETALDNYKFAHVVLNDGTLREFNERTSKWTRQYLLENLL